jgi:hypothetical protein
MIAFPFYSGRSAAALSGAAHERSASLEDHSKIMKYTNQLLLALMCALIALPVWANNRKVDIAVSPPVLAKKAKGPACLTIHANVGFQEINPDFVCLIIRNKDHSEVFLAPENLFADKCSELVAKFDTDKVRDAAAPPQVVLILRALRLDGTWFEGSAVLKVQ